MNEVLRAYESIRRDLLKEDEIADRRPRLDLYGMQEACCEMRPPRVLAQPEEVVEAIADFAPGQGWICRQSKLSVFSNAVDWQTDANEGVILCAELVGADTNTSLHIRQDGRGGWVLAEMLEGEGPGLAHTACLIGDQRVAGWLTYRVYWQHDEEQGWRTHASRLSGIRYDPEHKLKPCREA